MSTYTKEQLDSYSIFTIRDIAKEHGVSSPSKINKAELIDLILKISSGEMRPPEAQRRGRPRTISATEPAQESAPVNQDNYVRTSDYQTTSRTEQS